MQKVKFKFKLVSEGRLEKVRFYPENEMMSIHLDKSEDRKTWSNNEIELLIENPFDYTLKVFGVSDTEWTADLKIILSDGNEVNFLEWKGTTGDTARNLSVREKPVKDLPKKAQI